MATVIDSLVVELGLDPKNFTKGQQEALASFKKTQEQAVSSGKEIENQSKKSMEALGGIKTQALELFAVFTGGKGVVDFVTGLTHADSAVGRLSRSTGQSAETISKWQSAARIFGGDAASMAQSFTSLSDAFAGWKIGVISPLIADFRAISTAGGTIIDVNKGVEQSFLDLSANLQAINAKDPALAGMLGRRLGLDPALLDILLKGPEATKKILDQVTALGPATKASADAAGELERRWNAIFVRTEGTGRQVGVIPGILKAADFLNLTPSQAYDYLTNPNTTIKLGSPKFAGTSSGLGSDAGGAFTSQGDKEAFIRAEAAKRGINPDVALAVAKSEGFSNPIGDNGTSFGAFQLHVTPDGRGNAVGDQFKKATGRDPSDPANERAAIQFALDDARAHGWGAYHGAARVGIGAWAGIGGGSTSTSSTQVNINGPIHVTAPQGSDPTDFANRFAAAVKRQSYAAQANDGQN